MQYKLYPNGNNDTSNILKEVLCNRGVINYEQYLNLNENVVNTYYNLNNINEGLQLFTKHFDNSSTIGILVDEDPDGFCSAAMLYSYIKKMNSEYPVIYILHQRAKAHGLSEDIEIPNEIKLLIIPDAGTNDDEQCKQLTENGIDILILDHHEKERENPFAIIINNQTSTNYTNKSFCGAGIVYQFLKALDDLYWNDYANYYLDLCALANISDSMDMRSYETRYLTDMGLKQINNKCFQALIDAQSYSINNKININNIQWYITPILNGMIRVGSLEEKELLFKAFIEQEEYFEYKKRALKGQPAEIIQEDIYTRAARLCKNAKSRQDRLKEKSVEQISEIIKESAQDDKILLVDATDILDKGLTGVVAIKIAEIFNKPCILLNKFLDKKTNKYVYGGSARNINYSPIKSLKDVINETNSFNYGQGHPNAFGVSLDIDKKDVAKQELNYMLKDIIYDSTYQVDFIIDINNINTKLIMDLAQLENIICQGIEEPLIAIENIIIARDYFEIFGKKEDTITFTINDIKYIQFKCQEGNKLYDFIQDAWGSHNYISFNIVGKPSVNEYNGVKTPQIIIEDINIIGTF